VENTLDDFRNGRAYTVDAPTNVEVNAMRTVEAAYLHFVNYHAGRPSADLPQIEDVIPVAGGSATVHDDIQTATPVTDVDLDTEQRSDGLHVALDSLGLYDVVKLT
jgi:hypothetical protein